MKDKLDTKYYEEVLKEVGERVVEKIIEKIKIRKLDGSLAE